MYELPKNTTSSHCDETRNLLVRHRNGDRYAFSELLELYQAQVYSFLIRLGVDAGSRDDIFQEIFLKLHKTAHLYQSDRALEPWLFTIAANTARSYLRKQRIDEFVGVENRVSQHELTGQNLAEAKETALWLEQAILKLPFSQREVLVLSCVKNLCQKDIAEIVETPICTVKTNLRRARQALAKALARRNLRLQHEVRS